MNTRKSVYNKLNFIKDRCDKQLLIKLAICRAPSLPILFQFKLFLVRINRKFNQTKTNSRTVSEEFNLSASDNSSMPWSSSEFSDKLL